MLPIVKRKTLEIPHGLAAVAAAICLVLAFATDFSDRDRPSSVAAEKSLPTDFVARHVATDGEDRATATDSKNHRGGETRTQAGASALINWFGLSR